MRSPLLLVMGMHRSGTSLLGGVLQQLGVTLPGDMIAADIHNPQGYFEWRQVVDIQERLLIDLDRWWPSLEGTLALPKDWLHHPATKAASWQLLKLLTDEVKLQSGPWAIKDPRCSRLLPLWLQLAAKLELPLKLLLAVRDPTGVIHSLMRRDGPLTGLDANRGQQLWWRHNLEAIHAARSLSLPLTVFSFERWFSNPEVQIQDLLEACSEISPRPDQYRAALGTIRSERCLSSEVAVTLPLLPCVRRLYKRLLQRPLPQRWPAVDPPATLYTRLQNAKSNTNTAALQELVANPTSWPDLLMQWRSYPAPRRIEHVPLSSKLLISSCGPSWCELQPHLLLQRVPLTEINNIYLDSSRSNHHQLYLQSVDKTASLSSRKCDVIEFITLNLELPPPERAAHWLAHLRAQQLIWDPDPARVRLLRALDLPAWWLDTSAPANGWMQQPLAAEPDYWASELGLPPPTPNALIVLGSGGPDWEQSLAVEASAGEQIRPSIDYLPGWRDLIIATPTVGLVRAGWLATAARTAARLIEASATKTAADWALLDDLQAPPLALEQPFTPLDLRTLHAGKRPVAIARDVPTPPVRELFHWRDSSRPPQAAVLVSLYDYADRIENTLNSVLAQHQSALELIVVDDSSTDGGASVVHNWMQKCISRHHPFQRLLLLSHQYNTGLAATRNTAFTSACSPWCFVLDADNTLYPRAVSACLQIGEAGSNSLAVIHPLITIEAESWLGEQRILMGCQSWQQARFLTGNYIDAMALVRHKAWQAVGGYSDIAGGWEDYDFWCKLTAAGWYGLQCPQVLAVYNSHAGSMSHTVTRRSWRALSNTLQARHPWLQLPLGQT